MFVYEVFMFVYACVCLCVRVCVTRMHEGKRTRVVG